MHAKRMRLVILPSVPSPALQKFYALFHKLHDFRGGIFKYLLNIEVCFDFFYNFYLKCFAFCERLERDMIKICIGIYVKYLLLLEARGGVVAKALRYKPAGRGFDSRWFHWNFSLT